MASSEVKDTTASIGTWQFVLPWARTPCKKVCKLSATTCNKVRKTLQTEMTPKKKKASNTAHGAAKMQWWNPPDHTFDWCQN
eukprot:3727155-Amphidinium_carterae.1